MLCEWAGARSETSAGINTQTDKQAAGGCMGMCSRQCWSTGGERLVKNTHGQAGVDAEAPSSLGRKIRVKCF